MDEPLKRSVPSAIKGDGEEIVTLNFIVVGDDKGIGGGRWKKKRSAKRERHDDGRGTTWAALGVRPLSHSGSDLNSRQARTACCPPMTISDDDQPRKGYSPLCGRRCTRCLQCRSHYNRDQTRMATADGLQFSPNATRPCPCRLPSKMSIATSLVIADSNGL